MSVEVDIVDKYGGTSMEQVDEVVANVTENGFAPADIVVVSAPGKGPNNTTKLTQDLEDYAQSRDHERFAAIETRIHEHAEDFGARAGEIALETVMDLATANDRDKIVSIGERYSARLLAELIEGVFVDATDVIYFKQGERGRPKVDEEKTEMAVQHMLREYPGRTLVIPGFYGNLAGGLKTFPRGGSDISAAVLANLSRARLHRNWTDVSGIYTANPNLVEGTSVIPHMTYDELRAYGRVGTEAVHADAMEYLAGNDIDTNVRNTFEPDSSGTMITDTRQSADGELIVGLTGRKNLIYITVGSHGLNDHPGEIENFAEFFNSKKISIEHLPTGKDSMTAIVTREALMEASMPPELIETRLVQAGLDGFDEVSVGRVGAICLVGQNLGKNPYAKTEANYKVAGTLMELGIPTYGEDSFGSALSTVFIPEADVEETLRALHEEFFEAELKVRH